MFKKNCTKNFLRTANLSGRKKTGGNCHRTPHVATDQGRQRPSRWYANSPTFYFSSQKIYSHLQFSLIGFCKSLLEFLCTSLVGF